jgi:hypothetical protein
MTKSERAFVTAKSQETLRELLANLRRDYREVRALAELSGDEAVVDLRRRYASLIRELTLFGREEFGIEEAE